jgi:hypothetical protein
VQLSDKLESIACRIRTSTSPEERRPPRSAPSPPTAATICAASSLANPSSDRRASRLSTRPDLPRPTHSLVTMRARRPTAAAAAVAALALALAPQDAGAVLLDFEGIGNNNLVGTFYAGGGGGPSKNYGITFGTSAIGAVDADAGGFYDVANEPSPNTTVYMSEGESQAFLSVPGGFTGLSFQYASRYTLTASVYDGPGLTGSVLGTTSLPATGICDPTLCGDPAGDFGILYRGVLRRSAVGGLLDRNRWTDPH